MRTKINIIILMLCITIGHSFAQNFGKIDSIKQKIIALHETDTTVNNHRITIVVTDTGAVIRIYPMEGILQEFVITWMNGKLYSITNKCCIGKEKTIIYYGVMMIILDEICEYYISSDKENFIVYREMKEYEKEIFTRSITELLNHLNQLP